MRLRLALAALTDLERAEAEEMPCEVVPSSSSPSLESLPAFCEISSLPEVCFGDDEAAFEGRPRFLLLAGTVAGALRLVAVVRSVAGPAIVLRRACIPDDVVGAIEADCSSVLVVVLPRFARLDAGEDGGSAR